jgi:hypothetical protein
MSILPENGTEIANHRFDVAVLVLMGAQADAGVHMTNRIETPTSSLRPNPRKRIIMMKPPSAILALTFLLVFSVSSHAGWIISSVVLAILSM